MKQQILFVDDEPNLLHGLRRMLRPMRQSWDMHFAESGPAALEIMERQFCHVVVSDMRMPGMDGSQLLDKVRQYSPETIRLILSGHSDPKLILRSVGPTHQFLAKPCDADDLKTTLDRVCHLRQMLPVPSLVRMVTGIERLPSMPSLYHQVIEAVQEPADSLATIAPLIACDLGMTAKILQIVHSAFFGIQHHLSSPIQAVEMLGFDILQALVLDAQVFVAAEDPMSSDPTLQMLWSRSLAIALCAQEIMAAADGDDAVLDDAFSAGLLHDVGILVFMSHLPERYERSRELITDPDHPVCAVECDVIGASHTQVGAYLMGLWGLPDTIIDALAYHHQPSACPTQTWSPLSAVHIAEVLVHERKPHLTTGPAPILDTGYLETLGLQDCLPAWRQCAQVALQRHHSITEGHVPFHMPQEVAHA